MPNKIYKTLALIIVLLAVAGAVGLAASAIVKTLAPQSKNPVAKIPATNVNKPLAAAPGYRTYDVGEKSKFIRIDRPLPSDMIASPLEIYGAARGWYFEGSFPVELRDGHGQVIASGPAQAQGDWTSDSFVPFKLTLTFAQPSTTTGLLTFKKDNPSGLPENDDSVTVPVTFMGAVAAKPACRPTGCSGELCSDHSLISDCIYLSEYVCYKTAKCERQGNGECGWTPSPELSACIKHIPGQ